MFRRSVSAAVSLLAVLCLTAGSAWADGPYEPNESLDAARGPLPGATDVTAATETANDRDWFFFYSSGPRQLDISFQVQTCGSKGLRLSFRAADNTEIETITDFSEGAAERITYTTPGRRKYFLEVYSTTENLCPYRIRVDPGDAITADSPGHVLRLASDDPVRASVDGKQVAEVSNRGTDDPLSFDLGKLVEPQRLTLTVTKVGSDSSWSMNLTSDDAQVFSEAASAGKGKPGEIVRRVVLTPTGQVVDQCSAEGSPLCVPSPTTAPVVPTGPSAACRRARASVITWRARVKAKTRALRRARTARQKRRLRKELRRAKSSYSKALDRRAIQC